MSVSGTPLVRNVIYLHTHDMGRYISPYGYAVPTPYLQRFAETQGLLFRKAFCCGPTCSPSRAALLTGVTPHEAGMLGLAHRGFHLKNPEHHLAAFLKKNGFLTALCGIQHEFSESDTLPYDSVAPALPGENGSLQTIDINRTDSAVDFLQQKHSKPFFLSLGLIYPHRPFATADYTLHRPDFIRPPDPLPDTPEIRRDMADYHHTVNLADECLGNVFEVIRKTGRDRDSLIIVTTDHGISFPRMKCALKDSGTGVTLMLAFPGNRFAGKGSDALVSHLDIYPTVCDLLGLEAPAHLQGHTLRPLLEGTASSVRREVFSEVTFHAGYEPMRCIRTDRYKLIRRFDSCHPLANCDDSPSKSFLISAGWGKIRHTLVELYDLTLDPSENHNLAEDPAYAVWRAELEGRLEAWMRQTNDPLLAGPVQRPPGTRINTADSLDASEGPFEPIL